MPAAPDVSTGFGINVTLPGGLAFELTGVTHDDGDVEMIDVTHFGAATPDPATQFGGMLFLANDVNDPGTYTFEGHFNPDKQPGKGTTGPVEIEWPDGAKRSGEGTIMNYSFDAGDPTGTKQTCSVTVKLSGLHTVEPGNGTPPP